MTSPFDEPSANVAINTHFLLNPEHDDEEHDHVVDIASSDGDTASQRSIALSSPPHSPRHSHVPAFAENHENEGSHVHDLDAHQEHGHAAITPVSFVRASLASSKRTTMSTFRSSDMDPDDDRSFFAQRMEEDSESPISSIAPSVDDRQKTPSSPPPVRPSPGVLGRGDTESITSFGSEGTTHSYSKKARPESLLPQAREGPLVLGIALIDFDHLVGPKIEFARGNIFEDEEIARILPFLALPDGAHLSSEDYSYFHLVPSGPHPTTLFGISCNRQISAADLLVKDDEVVTRSTVQKAVVVLASKPIFGLVRDRLGVITRALFAQRDFSDMSILDDFHNSLDNSLRSQLTESGLYMGTSLRDLVHTFRQRTLVLLKALMLQKKIMFFGHPVERLCTFQYSLVTLVPGLLQHLDDCGSPPLAARAQTLSRPTSLRTSDPKSMMAYIGLPLDLFGKDAFFQPYLPLQQLDMLKDTQSWLCGSTNTIVTQQKEVDVLVNIETGMMEFHDPKLERVAGLTPADRKWMDEIVRDVNETFVEGPSQPLGMHFKGSDDYLRQKFDEYISGALASVKYEAFLKKGQSTGTIIAAGTGDPNSAQDFNLLWIQEFKKTNAYEVWERVTDPMLFDIVEARHPCSEKPSVVSDIGLRLSEGIQELKLDQQLAPTREVISRTITVGSSNLLKAVEGVRGRWLARAAPPLIPSAPNSSDGSQGSTGSTSTSSSAEQVSKEAEASPAPSRPSSELHRGTSDGPKPAGQRSSGLRPLSMAMTHPIPLPTAPPPPPMPETNSRFSGWVGSFFAQRASRGSMASASSSRRESNGSTSLSRTQSRNPSPMPTPPMPMRESVGMLPEAEAELEDALQPRNLDEVYGAGARAPTQVPEVHVPEVHEPAVHEPHPHPDSETELEEAEHDAAGTGMAL